MGVFPDEFGDFGGDSEVFDGEPGACLVCEPGRAESAFELNVLSDARSDDFAASDFSAALLPGAELCDCVVELAGRSESDDLEPFCEVWLGPVDEVCFSEELLCARSVVDEVSEGLVCRSCDCSLA